MISRLNRDYQFLRHVQTKCHSRRQWEALIRGVSTSAKIDSLLMLRDGTAGKDLGRGQKERLVSFILDRLDPAHADLALTTPSARLMDRLGLKKTAQYWEDLRRAFRDSPTVKGDAKACALVGGAMTVGAVLYVPVLSVSLPAAALANAVGMLGFLSSVRHEGRLMRVLDGTDNLPRPSLLSAVSAPAR